MKDHGDIAGLILLTVDQYRHMWPAKATYSTGLGVLRCAAD